MPDKTPLELARDTVSECLRDTKQPCKSPRCVVASKLIERMTPVAVLKNGERGAYGPDARCKCGAWLYKVNGEGGNYCPDCGVPLKWKE